MNEWTTQLSFSFRHLLKQRGILAVVLLLSTFLIALLVSANRLENFMDTWFGLLHVQMILLILLTPILLNAVWSGRIQVFESQTILYYLRRPESYFLARILTVWLVLAGSVIVFDTGFWLIHAREADSAIWAGAVLQILLTVGYVTALSGFFSLLLRRTVYSLLPVLLYLFASLSFIEHPMFALWFSPNLTEQVTSRPEQIAARSVLMIWILLLMTINALWFRRRTVR